MPRLEATFRLPLARHSPDREWLGKAPEALGAEVVKLEQAADELSRPLADHYRARLGERLKPRSQIRGISDHRLLLRRARAYKVSHDHPASVDADADLEVLSVWCGKPADRIDQLEASPHSPLGIVLMGLWPAEVCEHAIAHVLGDMTVESTDHFGAAVLVRCDHLAHVFRIELGRELRGPCQIAKHHRQLPTLR
ncbi:MAG TPA: hypothetical protein VFZ10_12540 [Geminicoccaceae bacterium]